MITTVLFAAALNEYSQSYFSFSMNLATQLSARLIILHIIEDFQATYEGIAAGIFGGLKWKEMLQKNKKAKGEGFENSDINRQMIYSVFQEFCQNGELRLHEFKNVDRKIMIEKGNITATIIRQAKIHNCDLIITPVPASL